MRAPVVRLTGSLVGAILFLNYLPFAATYGVACLPMYGVVGVLFFLPVIAVTCDLTARMPDGGIHAWVTEAFGRRFGLFAVYVQWLVCLTFQPAALSYAATAAALAVDPALAQSRLYTLTFTVAGAWVLTTVACSGFRGTTWVLFLCVALGMVLPVVLVIGVVGVRVWDGAMPLTLPSLGDLAFNSTELKEVKHLTGLLSQFGGPELYAIYAPELPNSAADYATAVKSAGAIVFGLYVAGSLVIAGVAAPALLAPHATLLGVLPVMGLQTLAQPMAALAALGGVGMALARSLPPAVGLARALRHAQLLPALHSVTTYGVPLPMLLLQCTLVSFLCGLFLLEDVGATFWVFTAVSAQLQLIMYITMFLAALRVLGRAGGPRPLLLYAAATTGLVTSAATLCLGFAPPKSVDLQVGWHATLMSLAVIVVSAVPLALPERRRALSIPPPKPHGQLSPVHRHGNGTQARTYADSPEAPLLEGTASDMVHLLPPPEPSTP